MLARFALLRSNRPFFIRIAILLLVLIVAAGLISAPKSPFTQNDKAYYADAKQMNFIRPGLSVTVMSAEIAADGTVKARVRFADPKTVPLDKDGIQTPGLISASAVVAYVPRGQTQYTSYTTRIQTSPINGVSAVQAAADSGGVWQRVAEGEYTYTFNRKVPPNYEKGATHAVGVYANRDLTEFDFGVALSDSVFTWVPDGSSKPVTRDVIRTKSCQKCHVDTFAFHGNTGRSSLQMCVLCHTPQTTDPDTGNTVDLPVMIHKIHMSHDLPSVQAGTKYRIIGVRSTEFDFSDIGFPTDKRNCTVCHEQDSGAAQAQAHLKPNRAACGACHDNVNFETGENHFIGLPQRDDTLCTACHAPQMGEEFDLSVAGAHMIPYNSSHLTGIKWAIQSVDNATPGNKPTVTFTIQDKNGNALAPSDFGRLNAVMGGPTTDYVTKFAGQTASGYVSEDMLAAKGSGGVYTHTFANAIPAGSKGTFSINLEGRRVETIFPGTPKAQSVQYGTKNAVFYFSVDGSAVAPRRTVVKIEKCQACHVSLRLHGENRVDTIEHCVTCHNPVETDVARRPAADRPVQSIMFNQLIHNIHGGEETKTRYKTEDYIVYGFGGSVNNFSEVKFPGRLSNCDICHVDGSQQLPLPVTNFVVANPRGYLNPSGPAAAACLGCHRGIEAASHALANTNATLGEGCAVCHGPDADFAVRKVHAIPSSPVGE